MTYIDFVSKLNKGYYGGASKDKLKLKFVNEVDKKDYKKAELDEIINYLFENVLVR